MSIDIKQLRARHWSVAIPPWGGEGGEKAVSSSTGGMGTDKPFKCMELLEGVIPCQRSFTTFRAMRTHMRKAHGTRSWIAGLVVTNQCPWCLTSFKSRLTAVHHADNAWQRGVCRADMTYAPWPVNDPDRLECPDCGECFDELPFLQRHLATHLPQPPPDLELAWDDGPEGLEDQGQPPEGRQEAKGRGASGGP